MAVGHNEALAWGIDTLGPEDMVALQTGSSNAAGNRAVIAAGTGLGEAGLCWDGKLHIPFATEGGHTDFAPATERDWRFSRRWLAARLADQN